MAEAPLVHAVSLPPKEAIAFLRQKTNVTSTHWTDLWNEAHSRGFMVAGAASQALVEDFRAEVAKALEQGTTLANFRKGFDAVVAKHGWVHNGTPAWRANIIYETNLSMAYAAGRYAQMTDPDVLEAFPYWRYQHNAALHPRLQHVAWSGLVLRADDPWWGTHYPPNGWRCHCSVSPVSHYGMNRMGRIGPDKAPPVDMRPWRNPKTGKVVEVPHGVDPGFGYNPGAAWLGRVQPGETTLRAEAVHPPGPAPAPASRAPGAAARPPVSVQELGRFLRDPGPKPIPIGTLHPDVAEAIGTKSREVLLSSDTVEKQLEHHPDLTVHDYAAVADIVAAPALAVTQPHNRVVLFKRVGRLLYVAVKRTADGGETFAVSLFRGHAKDVRRIINRGRVILGSADAVLDDEDDGDGE